MKHHENLDQTQIERTKPNFDSTLMLQARSQSWNAIEAISKKIQPGMTEEEATSIAQETLRALGSEKFWHRTIVRLGSNTLKGFSDPSEKGVTLKSNDIFYLDLGPVWNGYEGDAGQTFVCGNDPEQTRCAQDCKEIFETVGLAWRSQGLTGQALYALADQEAKRRGWILNLEINGHRLADFPHALYYKGSLSDQPFSPTPLVWVLEIQIRHPSREFGAFYEDLLLA
jgi:Xaa-Pro aminopeptidase